MIMDSYSSYSTSNYSSSSSSSASYSSTQFPYYQETTTRTTARPPPAFQSGLHSVRRPPAVKNKLPIAPLPPTPPRVYNVDPADFKDVVQKLTGASSSEVQRTRLQEVAPPPLSLSPATTPIFHNYSEEEKLHNNNENNDNRKSSSSFESYCGGLSPLGFSLSPASLAWCSSMLMSPGTLAAPFQPNAVL